MDIELMADLEEVNSFFDNQLDDIEFFYEPGYMSCPIEGCSDDMKFVSKCKWNRHWQEKHVRQAVKYICSMETCHAECRRRADMRAHIKSKHERDVDKAEDMLIRCKKEVRENKGYINPGFLVYRGRTKYPQAGSSSEPTDKNMLSVEDNQEAVASNTVLEVGVSTPGETSLPLLVPVPGQLDEASKLMLESAGPSAVVETGIPLLVPESAMEDDTRNVITSMLTNDAGNQTTSSAYEMPFIPPCPHTKEELEHFILWLCNSIDQFGRTRELAKRKLDELKAIEEAKKTEEAHRVAALEEENKQLKMTLQELLAGKFTEE